ncbi:hypothetical protein CJ030_MR6G001832 [Morella rubra]|uniref:Secreted protein n=1 Tax=Morella rubra TaxID=262757 RepID=A0A6A1VA69_9ROSI|nr:hypothetical protein CJ030_MR6G001832 [Morella rubra]
MSSLMKACLNVTLCTICAIVLPKASSPTEGSIARTASTHSSTRSLKERLELAIISASHTRSKTPLQTVCLYLPPSNHTLRGPFIEGVREGRFCLPRDVSIEVRLGAAGGSSLSRSICTDRVRAFTLLH